MVWTAYGGHDGMVEKAMGLKYLNGASWADITREERVFCARLYELIRASGAHAFVRYLNQRHSAGLDEQAAWEPAYELCLYRDLHHHRRAPGVPFSPKRTFDLALTGAPAITATISTVEAVDVALPLTSTGTIRAPRAPPLA